MNLTRLPARIAAKIAPDENGCWLWTGAISSTGYGSLNAGKVAADTWRYAGAHKYVYERLRGPVPDGLHLDHLCRVRACVNPAHLQPVTPAENVARAQSGLCAQGHDLDATGQRNGQWRTCRVCRNEKARTRYNASAKRTRLSRGVSDQVYARTAGRCEKCGRPMARASMHVHHRLLRSQGGKDDLANLLGLHQLCHNQHRESVHDNPRASYESGHLVRSHQHPQDVPVVIAPDETAVYLTADGFYREASPHGATEHG